MIAYVINPGNRALKLACAVIKPSLNPALPSQLQVALTRQEWAWPTEADASPQELIPALREALKDWPQPDAIVGRGGLIGRVPAGTYRLTSALAEHALAKQELLRAAGDHTSNLGGPLAFLLAQAYGVPAFIVDPQSVDELLPEARETGVPGVQREARFHALNSFVVARRAAYDIGKRLSEARVVVAHLGGNSSVTAFEQGRAIDTSGTAPDGGPLSLHQSGPLPTRQLLKLLGDSGPQELLQQLKERSGLAALTGYSDLTELEGRLDAEPEVQQAVQALVHQVCKAIGAQVAALSARPDAIALTGKLARWSAVMDRIERRLAWMAPVLVVPGELELEALAEGVGRGMLGLEGIREWSPQGVITHPPQVLYPPLPQPSPQVLHP